LFIILVFIQLLENDSIVTDVTHPQYDKTIHLDFDITLVKNRLHALRALLNEEEASKEVVIAKCWAPPRAPTTAWPYYQDNSIFGKEKKRKCR